MTVKKYRKKPVVIEALELRGDLYPEEVRAFCPCALVYGSYTHVSGVGIPTLEGTMTAQRGDYIIKGVAGEFYPCKPDIFEKTYEEVGL